ncbi:MAG: menaquinone biosynthesis protein [Acidobacteriia bacterium]|nr:menaquinone biosynthesis protein [Terriglobia bacterium]
MGKLRISIVEFLNTAPLVWGFTDGPLVGRYDLSFAVPSQCAEDLRTGRADVGIIPAIEYQRMENVVALPGMAVAAKNEVRSILVISKVPIEQARSFALDTNSRSSVGLVRLLCQRLWKIAPEFIDLAPDPDEMLGRADAALIIGDPALRLRLQVDALEGKAPQGEACCDGDSGEFPVKDVETLFVYDVAQQWREMTGLPCVLAIWVARRGTVTPEMVADFQASSEYGLAHIGEIAESAALKLNLHPRALERYLTQNIDFSLDERNLAGLKLYYEECARAGLIPRVRELEFIDAVSVGPNDAPRTAQQKAAL